MFLVLPFRREFITIWKMICSPHQRIMILFPIQDPPLHRERREMKAHLPMSRLKAGHIIPMIISIWPMFLRIL